jgi:uncharacterized protein YwgA
MNKSYLLLLLLSSKNSESIRGKTRLMKLMYIIKNELKKVDSSVDFYGFYKHYFGPYSGSILKDLNLLIRRGLVHHNMLKYAHPYGIYEENIYEITEEGRKAIKEKRKELPSIDKISIVFEKVKEKYNNMPLFMLIHEVYTKYPIPA